MGIRDRLTAAWTGFRQPETKASAAGGLISGFLTGGVVYSPRDYAKLADEAYSQNLVAYYCIRLIADAFGELHIMTMLGDEERDDHGVAELLRAPNPTRGGMGFRADVMAHHLISGNSYLEAVPPGPADVVMRPGRGQGRPPLELWTHRPERIQVIPGPRGLPDRFRFRGPGGERDWPVNPVSGFGYMLQVKDFHPFSDYYGLGPVEPAGRWIDLHNAGGEANAALLQNQGMNPVAIAVKGATPDQVDAARDRLIARFSDTRRKGEPLLMGGEMTITTLNQTLRDMQWTEGMREAARLICAAFRVPSVFIVPGESTYSNREQASLDLYEHAVLPRAEILLEAWTPWFRWLYGEPDLELKIDHDAISALEPRREVRRKSVLELYKEGVISHQEIREALDYGEADPDQDWKGGPLARPAFLPGVVPGQEGAAPGVPPGLPQPPGPDGKPPLRLVPNPAAPRLPPSRPAAQAAKAQPDDEPTEQELADAMALAEALLDDGLLESELASPLRDVVAHFGRRVVIGAKGDLAPELKAITDPGSPAIAEFVAGLRERAGMIGDTTRAKLADAIARAKRAGGSLITAIRTVFGGFSPSRVETIAATEAVRAAGFGTQLGMSQAGIATKEWLSQRDGRVRKAHVQLDGQIVPAGDVFRYEGHKTMYPGGFGVPELDLNCFPGSTIVLTPSAPIKAMRRYFEGEVVHLSTAFGNDLTVTRNHPILTDRGWVAADLIKEGDNLIRCVLPERAGCTEPDPKDVPPTLAEIFDLANATSLPERIPGVAGDFHGDGGKGDVDIVGIDRGLMLRMQSAFHQKADQSKLAGTGHSFASLLGDGRVAVARADERLSLDRCQAIPKEARGFLAAPDGDVVAHQVEFDRFDIHAESAGDLLGGSAGLIEPYGRGAENGIATCLEGSQQADALGVRRSSDRNFGLVEDELDPAHRHAVESGQVLNSHPGVVGGDDLSCGQIGVGAASLDPNGLVGCVRQSSPLFRGGPRHPGVHALASIPDRDAVLLQDSVKRSSANAEIARQGFEALAGLVTLDQVVNVSSGEFLGHVYNLETTEGFYLAEGIVASNCRCYAVPGTSESEAKAENDRDARWHAYDAELQHHEAMVREAVAQGFAAQERRAAVRLAERGSGAAA